MYTALAGIIIECVARTDMYRHGKYAGPPVGGSQNSGNYRDDITLRIR
jgi:hypothetical protein